MIEIRKPDDFHIHLRQGELLSHYLRDASRHFNRLLIMPNTIPPINSARRLAEYRDEIEAVINSRGLAVSPLYTFKLSPAVSVSEFELLLESGITAGKYYPLGATTNSEDGVTHPETIYHLLEAMEERDVVLCVHGEDPDAYVLERESAFIPVLGGIRRRFPGLRIVLEHVSTACGLEALRSMGEKTAGTITVHHIMRNLNDLIGGFLDPHLFCKPVLKHPDDQAALIDAAFGGESCFFLGTDSAPHLRRDKESQCGCAGSYTSPVAIPALYGFFSAIAGQRGWEIERFENFTSVHGADFYKLPLNDERISLVEREWIVPWDYHGVVPFLAGKKLQWSVE